MIYQPQPFDEMLFCDMMVNHYAALYKRNMHGWRFIKAAFVWKRLQYYKRLRYDLENCVHDLITEINKTHASQPIITTAG